MERPVHYTQKAWNFVVDSKAMWTTTEQHLHLLIVGFIGPTENGDYEGPQGTRLFSSKGYWADLLNYSKVQRLTADPVESARMILDRISTQTQE